MEGIEKITYLVDREVFELGYMPGVTSPRTILERIQARGKERNLPYKWFVIPMG